MKLNRIAVAPIRKKGIVGVFDALGAKNFTDEQLRAYINSHNVILKTLHKKADDQVQVRKLKKPTIFTFNDTVIIALEIGDSDEYEAIKGFAVIVRRFISFSLTKALFFRGAFSIGTYRVSTEHNLLMGNAVTDAASWYEQPEFIGAIATPKMSMRIKGHTMADPKPPLNLFFEHDVPCKSPTGQKVQKLFAVNWPKAFFVPSLRPKLCEPKKELVCLLKLLSAREIPLRTEHKYENTIKFFQDAPVRKPATS